MNSPAVHAGSNTMNKNNNNRNARGQPLRFNGSRGGKPAARPAPPANGNGGSRPGYPMQAFAAKGPAQGAGRQVAVAAAYASRQRSAAPEIRATRDECRIVHRELVASVTGSVAFTVAQTFALNPGLAASFPWLASQAQNWERYRFNRLKYCYYTRTGSNIPGSVQMVPDYDAADPAPVSEQVASSYVDVEEDAPWKDIPCPLNPAALHALGPTKFIRSGALAANQDVKTYDSGNFFLCTVDGTAVPWGKLWVEYDVTLMSPQLPSGGGGAIAALGITAAAATTASFLGTPTIIANSTPFATVAANVVTFNQAGQFLLVVRTVAATSATETAPPAAGAGAAFLYGPVQVGSGSAGLEQTMQITAVVGSTITFTNTLVGAATAVFAASRLPSDFGAL